MFVFTYESAIDAKGRVSIPASFRAALGGGNRIFLWSALDGSGCLEGGGEALMAMYRATLTRLAPHSPARKALVTRIIAGSADLTDRVKFAGNMDSFQIWNPDRHAEHFDAMAAEAAKEDTLEALGHAYSEVLHQQASGNAALKLVDGGDS